ncbi:MAG: proline dehydrogenase family protein [Deltaproteobacteria bacterium]|nr:proline dehydrogenase family protein [Deltaproteobacteria bacterium]
MTMKPMRSFLLWCSRNKIFEGAVSEGGAFSRAARRFVAGETVAHAVEATRALNEAAMAANLDFLGENTTTLEDANEATDVYMQLAKTIHDERLDASISIKLTQLGMDLGDEVVLDNTMRVVEEAAAQGVSVEIDMESSEYVDRTLDVYEAVQMKKGGVGIALQAYLRRSADDARRLVNLGAKVRVVKGAYKEPNAIAYTGKREIQDAFIEVLDVLMTTEAAALGVCTAIGSHDDVVVEYAQARAEELGLNQRNYEYQFLFGIRRDLQDAFAAKHEPVRIYVPYGTHWYPYFMRRLAERPANVKFFMRSLVGK